MSEKPIIFSTPMVQAILAGRKTQTRRVVKQPRCESDVSVDVLSKTGWSNAHGYPVKAYCEQGDVLWVRENWCNCANIDSYLTRTDMYAYKADYAITDVPWKWRPSIHMPRAAARIFLRVTDVRVEQLQKISVQDAYKEGFPSGLLTGEEGCRTTGRGEFAEYWDSVNTRNGNPLWKDNPWVWVISFERQ